MIAYFGTDLVEVIRYLIWQVRTEQQLRNDLLTATTSHEAINPPDDVEVQKRIEEVQQILNSKERAVGIRRP